MLSKISNSDGHGENSIQLINYLVFSQTHLDDSMRILRGMIRIGFACTNSATGLYHGLPEFRNAVANFMGGVRGNRVTFDPDRVVMSGGAT
ncbi:hypothetical protein EZV62_003095 [Acer yangbiense]|uniref:Aminotransferase class I/classII large domain-containing protein n=1 Tax=Acer yangbiense TaxID=1000413 RepID=A0A5C7IFT4_9ROSI|nr:hypothetical protein EZV62_003095 [Acer yangbiense]